MSATALHMGSREDISDEELVSLAQQAERLGYEAVFTGEAWGRDAFTVLTMIACHTTTLKLATGIIPVYSRTPGLIAQSIASLDRISKGRAILGLGTSGRLVIEQWHGIPYRKPVTRTREYMEIIRSVLYGRPAEYDGEFFQLSRFRLGVQPVQRHIPMYVASLGPRNLALTAELADGWLPIWVDRRRLPEMIGQMAEAALPAGRELYTITVAPQIICYVTEDAEELAETEKRVRGHMAYYIGGMGEYYYNLFSRSGFQAEANAVREAWSAGDRGKAAAIIPDELLENITIIGDAAACLSRMERFRRAGADMPVVAFPHGSNLEGMRRTMEVLAPANAG